MPHPRLKNLNRNLPGFNHLDFKELHRETQMDIVNKMAKRAKKRSEKLKQIQANYDFFGDIKEDLNVDKFDDDDDADDDDVDDLKD